MKGEQADLLIDFCAKVASKAPKIIAYVIVYETKNGSVRTQRSGSHASQIGLAKVVEQTVLGSFVPVKK